MGPWAAWAAEPGQSSTAAGDAPTPLVSVYVVLEGEPVALAVAGAKSPVALAGIRTTTQGRAVQIQAQQAALQNRLDAMGLRVVSHFQRLANAIKVQVPAARLAELQTLPGVVRVDPVRRYRRGTITSVPLIGAPGVWASSVSKAPGFDGSTIRIGVIDTGIDYTHADFGGSGQVADYAANDPTRIEPGTFPTTKVAGGYDFAGEFYNASDPNHAVPRPDSDPLDSSVDGHGTHVAGIIAGYGVLTNGTTFAGPYSGTLKTSQFAIGPGVAPRALLFALKVFGKESGATTDLAAEALEWAADPNGDFDFQDRLDVVNLSLGSDFGSLSPEDTERTMINRLADLGCVVVAAAGNDGNTFYSTDAPAISEGALSVASSKDSAVAGQAIQVTEPAAIAGQYLAVEGDFTKPLSATDPITGKVVYAAPHDATSDLTNGPALQGNIALIDRGVALFVDKIHRAQAAGAIAVIMVNNVDDPPFIMGGEDSATVIPGVMISKSDGAICKSQLASNLTVRLDASLKFLRPELVDQIDDYSSRGPGSPDSFLKPEIAAPGSGILSAAAGQGTHGVTMSGTSMATAHLTGAAALIKQIHPSWSAEDVKAALMNTAVPTHDDNGNIEPESRAGAGRLQVDRAAQIPVTAAAGTARGLVGLSFGALELTDTYRVTRPVQLRNHGTNDIAFQVAISNTVARSGITLAPLTNSITVPANSAVSVPFELTANPALFDDTPDATTPDTMDNEPRQFLYEMSGQIWFMNTAQSNLSIHLPFYVNARAAADCAASVQQINLPVGTSSRQVEKVILPLQGVSANVPAVVSAFQLGMARPHPPSMDPNRAAVELLAVGAASDIAAYGSLLGSLYIGVATAGPWTTPQRGLCEFRVSIDTNQDGIADYYLFNDTTGTGDTASDVFITVVENASTGEQIQGGYLNIYPADQLATAPFNNDVLVLSAPFDLLDLTAGSSRIWYKVETFGSSYVAEGYRPVVNSTPWIAFNPSHPAVDTAAYGMDGVPMHYDGLKTYLRVDRASAASEGSVLPGVLLLHHFNTQGKRLEIVRLNLSDDADNDTLPDWWEMLNFKGLATANAGSDQDRDGFSDYAEYWAGTNPKDAQSLLKLLSVKTVPHSGVELQWASQSDQHYTVERSAGLLNGFAAVEIGQLPATPPVNTFLDTNATGAGPFFYRIRLDWP